jgi:hypothetical protein
METGFKKNNGIIFIERRINADDLRNLQKYKKTKVVSFTKLQLENLDFLVPLTELEDLRLYECSIQDPSALSHFEKLRSLFINGVRNENNDFAFLSQLTAIEQISIGYAPQFRKFPDLSNCQKLKNVTLFNCKRLENIDQVALIPNLEKFSIVETPQKPNDLEFVMKMPSLKYLSGAFGGKKVDEEFHLLLEKYGIEYE